jgi:hypothetical protein
MHLKYIKEAHNAEYTVSYNPNQLSAPSSFNTDSLLNKLRLKWKSIYNTNLTGRGVYIKNLPHSYYDWHTDIGRDCSINWVLKTNSKAVTLFREHIPAPVGSNSFMYDIEEIVYTLYKPTLLDTTKEHCIINPSNDERIIFSLSINAPFEQAKEFFSNVVV